MLSRLVREAASRHRQGPVLAYLQITRSFSLATGQEAPPLDDSKSTTNEFLKSFGVLLEEPKEAKTVGRWDWHLWQLCAALLPALGIVGLAHFARSDMKKQEAILLKREEEKAAEDQAGEAAQAPGKQTDSPSPTADEHIELQAKVARMEKALQIMQIRQLVQQTTRTDVQHGAGPQGPSQPGLPDALASIPSDSSVTEQSQSSDLTQPSKHASPASNQVSHTSAPQNAATEQPVAPSIHVADGTHKADLMVEIRGNPSTVSALHQYLQQQMRHVYAMVKSALFIAEEVKDGAEEKHTDDKSVGH